ncbi:histidine kinase [Paenibacillus swuensis]|uniref:histidine kinase n=1 Tax=Paenibacillus swuensis TaxID=1178515 RepID=A0A172TND9_9BACL|nr:sensor histidine kinase [Paenibacillus swuensis]ANE48571.1 histidine kinase [Paenibacillus swuensis]
MGGWRNNVKWQMIAYFLIATVLVTSATFAGCVYFAHSLDHDYLWLLYLAGVLFLGLIIGYIAAQNIQRKLNVLQLSVFQMSKGNFTNRVAYSESDSFHQIYRDFNEMAESVEVKVKMLQTLGEELVMQRAESEEDAVLEERKRLARDLHDTVAQQLFAIHMSASSLPKLLERNSEASLEVLQQLIQMSQHAQKQMRSLIAQLRPLELDGQSLESALDKWFPDYCRQNSLQGTMDIQLIQGLSDAKEHQFFLIVQEAMANVTKHASASRVTLSLYETDNQYMLTISDNGSGFDGARVKLNSYGLSTMLERAQKLGGSLEVLSKPGAGTRVKAAIPKFSEAGGG